MDIIAKVCVLARERGMSYGRYMALEFERRGGRALNREELLRKFPEQLNREDRVTCRGCGKLFSLNGRTKNTKYCTPECYRESNARKAKQRFREAKSETDWQERTCVVCGKPIPPEAHGSRILCSAFCGSIRREQKRKEKKCLTKSF